MTALAIPTSSITSADARLMRTKIRADMRKQAAGFQAKTPQPDVHIELEHGWLFPTIRMLDGLLWGRWEHWTETTEAQALLDDPIPPIEWTEEERGRVLPTPARPMLEAALDCIGQGPWQKWTTWEPIRYFVDWLLFALGCELQAGAPSEPAGCDGANDRLYQVFCVDVLQLWPYDHLGDILCETKYGKKNGFFPTPMYLAESLTQQCFEKCQAVEDKRTAKTMDPALGTGRFLLCASNYSFRLAGMDIDPLMVRASVVNGYLYAPWMIGPFAFLQEVSGEPDIESPEELQWQGRQAVMAI